MVQFDRLATPEKATNNPPPLDWEVLLVSLECLKVNDPVFPTNKPPPPRRVAALPSITQFTMVSVPLAFTAPPLLLKPPVRVSESIEAVAPAFTTNRLVV